MALQDLFRSFSRRTPEATKKAAAEIPVTTRTRILRWSGELYRGDRPSNILGKGDYNFEFWQEIYRRLQYRTGKVLLTAEDDGHEPREAANYVMSCSTVEFLDFLEDIFNNEAFRHVNNGDKNIVDELNTILLQDHLPYAMTHFVIEEVTFESGVFKGRTGLEVRSYQDAMAPTLELLSQPHFRSANAEFLAALEDYRKGDIGDCLVKCASSFESVLKVICERKRWPYKQTDTAGVLIKTVIAKTGLDNYFEQLLISIATMRNRMSTAHGAGVTVKQPPPHMAQYALNMTASAIVMLTQETGV
jgi:hypothetical protein